MKVTMKEQVIKDTIEHNGCSPLRSWATTFITDIDPRLSADKAERKIREFCCNNFEAVRNISIKRCLEWVEDNISFDRTFKKMMFWEFTVDTGAEIPYPFETEGSDNNG